MARIDGRGIVASFKDICHEWNILANSDILTFLRNLHKDYFDGLR